MLSTEVACRRICLLTCPWLTLQWLRERPPTQQSTASQSLSVCPCVGRMVMSKIDEEEHSNVSCQEEELRVSSGINYTTEHGIRSMTMGPVKNTAQTKLPSH